MMEDALTCSRQKFLFDGVPREHQTLANLTQLQQRQCLVAQLGLQLESAKQDLWDFKHGLCLEDCDYPTSIRRNLYRSSSDSVHIFHDDESEDDVDDKENGRPEKIATPVLRDLTSSYNFTRLTRGRGKSPESASSASLGSAEQFQQSHIDGRAAATVPMKYLVDYSTDRTQATDTNRQSSDAVSVIRSHPTSIKLSEQDSSYCSPVKLGCAIDQTQIGPGNDKASPVLAGPTGAGLQVKSRGTRRNTSAKRSLNAKLLAQLSAVKKGNTLLRMSPNVPTRKSSPRRHRQWTPRTSPLRNIISPVGSIRVVENCASGKSKNQGTSRRLFTSDTIDKEGQFTSDCDSEDDSYIKVAATKGDLQEQYKLYNLLNEITSELSKSESLEHFNEVSLAASSDEAVRARSDSPSFILKNDVSPSAYMTRLSIESRGVQTESERSEDEQGLVAVTGGPNQSAIDTMTASRSADVITNNPFAGRSDTETFSLDVDASCNPFLTPVKSIEVSRSPASDDSDMNTIDTANMSLASFTNGSDFSSSSLAEKRNGLRRLDSLNLSLKDGPRRSAVLQTANKHARMPSYAIDDEKNTFRLKSPARDESLVPIHSPGLKNAMQPVGSIRRGLHRLKSILQAKTRAQGTDHATAAVACPDSFSSGRGSKSDKNMCPQHISLIPQAKWSAHDLTKKIENSNKFKRITIQPWPKQKNKYARHQGSD